MRGCIFSTDGKMETILVDPKTNNPHKEQMTHINQKTNKTKTKQKQIKYLGMILNLGNSNVSHKSLGEKSEQKYAYQHLMSASITLIILHKTS